MFIENIMHFLCGKHPHFGSFSLMSLVNSTIVHFSAIIIRTEQFSIHTFQTDWNMKLNMNNPFSEKLQHFPFGTWAFNRHPFPNSDLFLTIPNSVKYTLAFSLHLWIFYGLFLSTTRQTLNIFRCFIGITAIWAASIFHGERSTFKIQRNYCYYQYHCVNFGWLSDFAVIYAQFAFQPEISNTFIIYIMQVNGMNCWRDKNWIKLLSYFHARINNL